MWQAAAGSEMGLLGVSVLSYGTVRPRVSLDNSLCSKGKYTELCNVFAGSFWFWSNNYLPQCNGPYSLLIKRSPHHERLCLGISGEMETPASFQWVLSLVFTSCGLDPGSALPSMPLEFHHRPCLEGCALHGVPLLSSLATDLEIIVQSVWESQQGE